MADKGQSDGKYQWKNLKNQYIAAFAANIIFSAHGAMNGWLSPALPTLLSDETPLKTGPLTTEQLSWIGSINSLAGILGTFTFGLLSVWLGCKRAMVLLSIPCISFWGLIYFGTTYYHILIARFCNGFNAGGIQTTVILFISDIANDNIRGQLGSISYLTRNTAILLMYTLGAVLSYKTIPLVFVFIPISFGLLFILLPNTPQYYLQKSQFEKAENALRYYKGCKKDDIDEAVAFHHEFERLKSLASERKVDETNTWKDILSRDSLKGILNGATLSTVAHFTGFLVFITYASLIFEKVGATKIDPNVSSITIAVVQIIGTLCTTKFSDSLGRKAMLIISLLGSAFGMLLFALYSYLRQCGYELSMFEWVPVTSLSFVFFIASSGIVPLMFVCTVEGLPPKIRTVGVTIVNVVMNFVSFFCLKLFPIMMVKIGLHGCMLTMAICCIFGSLYVFFIVKETKGISMDSIGADNKKQEQNRH